MRVVFWPAVHSWRQLQTFSVWALLVLCPCSIDCCFKGVICFVHCSDQVISWECLVTDISDSTHLWLPSCKTWPNFFSYPIIFLLIVSAFKTSVFFPFASFPSELRLPLWSWGNGEHMGKNTNCEIWQTYGWKPGCHLVPLWLRKSFIHLPIPSSVKMKLASFLPGRDHCQVQIRPEECTGIVLPAIYMLKTMALGLYQSVVCFLFPFSAQSGWVFISLGKSASTSWKTDFLQTLLSTPGRLSPQETKQLFL